MCGYGFLLCGWGSNTKYSLFGAVRAALLVLRLRVGSWFHNIGWCGCLSNNFDFSESESDLVSGFKTDYYGLFFAIIFACEYAIMVFFWLVCLSYFLSCVS
ncbi:unnamed protein product [Protopolystoma xenopodis]|uniref:NADH-ubiquinone oxidoreductase chain 1 n=1 Tax=Protopolystoma xenopodis TaxID=117903 RepID=A0A3S5AJR8_9PLAT|nr:unnamed protein product [Protopolystoma xenopodis]